MRALTVLPGKADSVEVGDLPEPDPGDDLLLVRGLAVGVCGTDREIADGRYGEAPPGRDRLVLGHESLGRVAQAPPGSGFAAGDLVAGVVRRPDPVPCGACARDEFDMCRNGRYTERGIKGLDGFGSQWWTVEPRYAVRLDPALGAAGVLLEPASVVVKAWEQVDRVGARAWSEPHRVLVTGAGPIGLLAALIGVGRGLAVDVLDVATDGPKRAAVEALGARYHCAGMAEATRAAPDIIIEATGVSEVVVDAMAGTGAYGVVCLTGVSGPGRHLRVDVGAVNRELVLDNDVVVGSVNANARHYAEAARVLGAADPAWLAALVTRRVPLAGYAGALAARADDIKVVIDLD
ncbi:threonine dehydrogenase [Pilimelia terevasa]|uniref:Threonine dehydrogenase n=1 Tax=Pilimelia terevasa TaxID=53372 RepID=A0A8J3FLG0_9ACTN|nr:glucose 1-dehydrogenase [Pilimelia terevasa]GGK34196.1 threonine dehydrogenase [Pilimelia terevasa]